MPPTRTPLSSIFRNRPKGCEISLYMRGQVISQAFKGAKPTEIARDLKLDCKSNPLEVGPPPVLGHLA